MISRLLISNIANIMPDTKSIRIIPYINSGFVSFVNRDDPVKRAKNG